MPLLHTSTAQAKRARAFVLLEVSSQSYRKTRDGIGFVESAKRLPEKRRTYITQVEFDALLGCPLVQIQGPTISLAAAGGS
jgi:hypothetical protein